MQESPSSEPPSTKYTVVPIELPQHFQKLQKYINSKTKLKSKASLCRFYLRGLCIMKSQYCKFAHSTQELQLNRNQQSQQQTKKKQFIQKKQFNQPSLFALKNIKYNNLYQFQFTQRYKLTNLPIHDIDTITDNRYIRIRIREIMHRHNWDGFLHFIQNQFPETNFPISFISFWFASFGFDKPSSRCKFGDFIQYAIHVRKYVQIDIIFPPSTTSSIYLVNTTFKKTILQQNIDQLYKTCMHTKQQQNKIKLQEMKQLPLPPNLAKKYLCRYFMSGYCQQFDEQCLYAHSIQELQEKYQLSQIFPIEYRQPILPIQIRKNYLSLYRSTRKYKQYQQYTLQDINLNSTIKSQLRSHLHKQLYSSFLNLLQKLLNKNIENTELFSLPLKNLQKYYYHAGFNHTNQNRFNAFQNCLWAMGYYMHDVVGKDESLGEGNKHCYVYKISNIEYFNSEYQKIVKQCVENQLKILTNQDGLILQSALKRAIYIQQSKPIMPLHIYLKYRNIKFHELLAQYCTPQQFQRIFFESNEQNINKLVNIIKKQLKKNKKYIVKIDEFGQYLKQQKKDEINFNHHFLNLKQTIQTSIIETGRKIYFWPFQNNAYMVDSNLITHQFSTKPKRDQLLPIFKQKCTQHQLYTFLNQRIIIIDNTQKFLYSKKYLQCSYILGIDLQGKLNINGYIDLIQISACKRNQDNSIAHKQIFIFDIFYITSVWKNGKYMVEEDTENKQMETNELILQANNTNQNQNNNETNLPLQNGKTDNLYQQCTEFLKIILQDKKRVKILHDCRHDSIALKHILNITLNNVFDTSGFDIYLCQKHLYKKQIQLSTISLLRKIYEIRTPSLNTILDTYKAPNGINIFKDSMKKKFGDPNSRTYFEQRPIDEEFLQYSAKDVEDLIEVYENMIEDDTEQLSQFIGSLYSKC